MRLKINLLGGFTLRLDDRDLPPIHGKMARSLFAYLAYHRNRPHTRDLLAGMFWPEVPDAVARRRLSQALWRIGQTIRASQTWVPPPGLPQPLLTTKSTVQLNPHFPIWLDVEEFKQCRAACLARGSDALDQGERGLQLYQGPFLAGSYDDWIVLERERLREHFLELLETLVEQFKRQGDFEKALTYARRLTRTDPLREAAHREVMQICHLLARDTEALQQYRTLEKILVEELNTQPGSETHTLAAEIGARAGLQTSPVLPAPAQIGVATRLERPDQLPLVGRSQELAALVRMIENTGQGRGGLTAIFGEAGIGKSRLLREAAANAAWRGLRTVWGRCYELSNPPAYQPLVEALRTGVTGADAPPLDPLWQAVLSRLLPELATEVGLPPDLSPDEERRRLLEAITQGFLALAAANPTLVVLEDIHWVDPASLEVLRYLLPRLQEQPLLFLLSIRPEDLTAQAAAIIESLEGTRQLGKLFLTRLAPEQTDQFVQVALELPQPAPRFSARLHTETEGNPFFLIEVLWTLMEDQLLFRDEGGTWSTPWDKSTEDYAELPLPAGVAQSIQRRLDRLPAALEDSLGIAAVIGRTVPFELWKTAGRAGDETLLAAAEDLCSRGLLLAADPNSTADWDYAFTHDLIRRVAYEQLPPPKRRQYHQGVALALADLPRLDYEALASHWTLAGEWEKSAAAHQQAGERALLVYANLEAAAHFTQALASLERVSGFPDHSRRYQLLLAREAIFDLLGDRERQQADLEALNEVVLSLDDDRRRAEIALREANYAHVLGDYTQAIETAKQVVVLAQSVHDVRLEAVGHASWGQALSRSADYESARQHTLVALQLVQNHGLPQVELECLNDLGRIAYHQGELGKARDYYDRALSICRQIGNPHGEWDILNNLGLIHRVQSDYSLAQEAYDQVLSICRKLGDRRGEAMVLNNIGTVHRRLADYPQANHCQELALEISQEIGDRWNEGQILINLGNNAYYQGDYGVAQTYFTQALALWCDIGNRRGEAGALANLGCVARHLGNYVQGEDYLEVALDIFRDQGDRNNINVLLRDLSLLHHFQGHPRKADQHAREAQHIAQYLGDRSSQGHALTLIGHAAEKLGQFQQAAAAYCEAWEIQQALGEHHLALESQAGLAGVVMKQGDLARAAGEVEAILTYLKTGSVEGSEDPFQIYMTCYNVLRELNDKRADHLLGSAYTLLRNRAERISNPDLRRSFLENVPIHQKITKAYLGLSQSSNPAALSEKTPTNTFLLPRANAPLGRPLRADEFIPVTWTISADEDQAIQSKVQRRRHRILRLLREARAQGAAPRDQDLAGALEVSLATLRRDMAALRAEGHDLPTRWRARR